MKQVSLGDTEMYFPQDTPYMSGSGHLIPDDLYAEIQAVSDAYWAVHKKLTEFLEKE